MFEQIFISRWIVVIYFFEKKIRLGAKTRLDVKTPVRPCTQSNKKQRRTRSCFNYSGVYRKEREPILWLVYNQGISWSAQVIYNSCDNNTIPKMTVIYSMVIMAHLGWFSGLLKWADKSVLKFMICWDWSIESYLEIPVSGRNSPWTSALVWGRGAL